MIRETKLPECIIKYTVNNHPMTMSTFTSDYALTECYELLLKPEVTFIQLYRLNEYGDIVYNFILKDELRKFYEPEKSYV